MRQKQGVFSLFLLSPSSRRAWIEITPEPISRNRSMVALLAEGVDRNTITEVQGSYGRLSPSSRRAWIEIDRSASDLWRCTVALLAEGVDRNGAIASSMRGAACRPPRGGRG